MAVHGLVKINARAIGQMNEEGRGVGFDVLKTEDGRQGYDEEEAG
jgi:hypothetical protein